jgi:DNA replication protein DnaC
VSGSRGPTHLSGVGLGDRPACRFGVCDGSGWIVGPENVARPCDCRDALMARRRTKGVRSVIPARYRDVSFDLLRNDATDPHALAMVEEFVQDLDQNLANGDGFWLHGPVGTGKTSLSMLTAKAALERGRGVAIYSLPKLLARIRATFDRDLSGDSYDQFFTRLISVDLLHIDDLGAEQRSDWVLEQLYSIVNERYEAKRSMVVTSNLDPKGLTDQIGTRTVSRLQEMCSAIEVGGTDRRTAGRVYRVERA